MRFAPLFRQNRPHRQAQGKRPATRQPSVERLEDRTVLSVSILDDFAGLNFRLDRPALPPDTHLAAGPRHLVEVVNSDIAFFSKNSEKPLDVTPLASFFASVGPFVTTFEFDLFDPRVTYDELANRFIVTALNLNRLAQTSDLVVAVSDDADPRGAWEMHRINVENGDAYWGDYDQLGWDADAIYLSLVMQSWDGNTHGASVITIDKASILDNDNATFAYFDADRSPTHYLMQPAVMHGAKPNDPMYFVEANPRGGSVIRVVRMTDKLSASPTFKDFELPVAQYDRTPDASQPSGDALRSSRQGASIMNAVWRGGRLVASHHAGSGDLAQARWYEINTNGSTLTLTQSGLIDPGPGVHTYYPSIEIAPNGDLGMTFMQSSASEFPSVYITGRKLTDPLGQMQTPLLVKSGEASFLHPDFANPAPFKVGDYSGISIDPQNGTFWAGNEYAKVQPDVLPYVGWGTWIANFSISSGSAPTVSATGAQSGDGSYDESALLAIVGELDGWLGVKKRK